MEAGHKLEETATWTASRVNRNFALVTDPYGSATVGDPNEVLDKFVTGSPENYGRFSDPVVDKLFDQQSRETDEGKRIPLVRQMSARLLEKAWRIQGLFYSRIEVRSARMRNYEPHPSHHMNRRFEDVWRHSPPVERGVLESLDPLRSSHSLMPAAIPQLDPLPSSCGLTAESSIFLSGAQPPRIVSSNFHDLFPSE